MIGSLLNHIWRARPSAAEVLLGAPAWSVTVMLCALSAAFLAQGGLPPETQRIALIYFIGALPALPLTLWLLRMVNWRSTARLWAGALVLLGGATLAGTAFVFAFDFWWYFAQWHGTRFSRLWFLQLFYTFAAATYQFIVMGLRLYVPFGVAALALAAWLIARRVEPRGASW